MKLLSTKTVTIISHLQFTQFALNNSRKLENSQTHVKKTFIFLTHKYKDVKGYLQGIKCEYVNKKGFSVRLSEWMNNKNLRTQKTNEERIDKILR